MMDERLEQMEESLFGSTILPPDEADDFISILPPTSSKYVPSVSMLRPGLSFEEFVTKIGEMNWDSPAGAMGLEMLEVQCQQQHNWVKLRLERVERTLIRILASDDFPGTELDEHYGDTPESESGADSQPLESLRTAPTALLHEVLRSRTPNLTLS
mmetsp:Transcript_10724/g.24118  ORF Transcript_10724/g.24118 Transcript_10724/m.24118 type:complete len:156 (+) Transcript_10724:1-468(+)